VDIDAGKAIKIWMGRTKSVVYLGVQMVLLNPGMWGKSRATIMQAALDVKRFLFLEPLWKAKRVTG
jgi:hypothetical protein